MQVQGRKEVVEAVAIAALTTLANGLIQFWIDHMKECKKTCPVCKKKRKKDKK